MKRLSNQALSVLLQVALVKSVYVLVHRSAMKGPLAEVVQALRSGRFVTASSWQRSQQPSPRPSGGGAAPPTPSWDPPRTPVSVTPLPCASTPAGVGPAAAVAAVQQFWEAQLPMSTPAGAHWRGLVQQAYGISMPSSAEYSDQADELCKALSMMLPAMAETGQGNGRVAAGAQGQSE